MKIFLGVIYASLACTAFASWKSPSDWWIRECSSKGGIHCAGDCCVACYSDEGSICAEKIKIYARYYAHELKSLK